MQLTDEQREHTTAELENNMALAGLTPEQLAEVAGLSLTETQAALNFHPEADPSHIWLLRDTLDSAVRAGGQEPDPYSVLTDANRPR